MPSSLNANSRSGNEIISITVPGRPSPLMYQLTDREQKIISAMRGYCGSVIDGVGPLLKPLSEEAGVEPMVTSNERAQLWPIVASQKPTGVRHEKISKQIDQGASKGNG